MPSLMFVHLVVSEELRRMYARTQVQTESHFIYIDTQIATIVALAFYIEKFTAKIFFSKLSLSVVKTPVLNLD